MIYEILESPFSIYIGRIVLGIQIFITMCLFLPNLFPKKNTFRVFGYLVCIQSFLIPLIGLIFQTEFSGILGFLWTFDNVAMTFLLVATFASSEFLGTFGLIYPLRKQFIKLVLSSFVVFLMLLPEVVSSVTFQSSPLSELFLDSVWTIDTTLTIYGSYRCFFKEFSEIFKRILGNSEFLFGLSVLNVIIVIVVGPTTLPYGKWIPKVGSISGALWALVTARRNKVD